jgi:dihydrofolate reductase
VGKIVVSEFVSLDGVMEAPGGEPNYRHTGWVAKFPDAGQFKYKLDEILAHEAHLLGRRTYESFAGAWPARTGLFADKINSMPKYVASTTLATADWNNTTVLRGDTATAVATLKQQLAGDILVAGSRTLVTTLRRNDLVDEHRLMVFRIILASGMRLFDETADAPPLELMDTQRFDNGIVNLIYRPVQAAGQRSSR